MGRLTGGAMAGEAGRWRSRVWRPHLVLALLAGLFLAGCYDLKEEVIPASLGVVIPYGHDAVELDGGGRIMLSRAGFNNDYRFLDVSDDGRERLGTFRAMPVKDNIHAVQARYDDEKGYILLFYAISRDRIEPVDVSGVNLREFAALYGVGYEEDEFSGGFTGDPARILAMLKGMGGLEFE